MAIFHRRTKEGTYHDFKKLVRIVWYCTGQISYRSAKILMKTVQISIKNAGPPTLPKLYNCSRLCPFPDPYLRLTLLFLEFFLLLKSQVVSIPNAP